MQVYCRQTVPKNLFVDRDDRDRQFEGPGEGYGMLSSCCPTSPNYWYWNPGNLLREGKKGGNGEDSVDGRYQCVCPRRRASQLRNCDSTVT
jgi:hypothetical protein